MARLPNISITEEEAAQIENVVVLVDESTEHLGLVARHVFEGIALLPVVVSSHAQFSHDLPRTGTHTLVVAVSPLEALTDQLDDPRPGTTLSLPVISIAEVNGRVVQGRKVEVVLSGTCDVGAASPIQFPTLTIGLTLLALWLGRRRGLSRDRGREVVFQLAQLPSMFGQVLEMQPEVEGLAIRFQDVKRCLFFGNGVDLAAACAVGRRFPGLGRIDLQESKPGDADAAYIEGLDEDSVVVAVLLQEESVDDALGQVAYFKSQRARTIALVDDRLNLSNHVDAQLLVSTAIPPFSTLVIHLLLWNLLAHFMGQGPDAGVEARALMSSGSGRE